MILLVRLLYAVAILLLIMFDFFTSIFRLLRSAVSKIHSLPTKALTTLKQNLLKLKRRKRIARKPKLSPLKKSGTIFTKHVQILPRTFSFRLRAPVFFRKTTRPKQKKRLKKERPQVSVSLLVKLRYFAFGATFSFMFLFIPLALFIFLLDLPSPKELSYRHPPQTTKIYDRNGTLLYQMYATQNRTLITLSDVPGHLQQATLAIEDKNFYKHPGFDITSIIRAARENMTGGNFQGGSTITQQLIKSSLLTPEPTIIRKVKEVTLAFWAERLYSKDQILEMYFNQVPYGGTAWGVEAASEIYFGKKVRDLTLPESAFLAGVTAAPSIYSPYNEQPTLWKKRQREVLNRMTALGYISKKQADEAAKTKLQFKGQQIAMYAPHFVEYVREQLIRRYGLAMVERGGLQVITTLDLKTHQTAQNIVTEEVAKAAYLNLTNGAVLVTNPATGEILAMVGSKDFTDKQGGNVNVTTAYRQPGSSIKVVTYSAALARGMTAATIIPDTPITYAVAGSMPYSPVNYDGRYYGQVPLRFALANSLNIPAVRTLNQIGIPTMVTMGKDMGIKSWGDPDNYGLSVTLGGAEVTMLDIATVYGTLANDGLRKDLNPIISITDSKGNLLEQRDKNSGNRVLREGVAFIISDILSDTQTRAVAFGNNSPLNIPGRRVSVKTGTTDNKRDNWTVGYTDKYVVAVWVGNNDNSPMSQSLASGVTGAAPIWNRVMTALLANTPAKTVEVPQDVIRQPCLGKMEYFLKGTENTVSCAFRRTNTAPAIPFRRSY